MAKIRGVYKCNVCGNVVEVLHSGGGTLVCCGEDMHLFTAKNMDEGVEKHLPVVEKDDQFIHVRVGEVLHPMEDTHYIEWIEIMADGQSYQQFLNPGDKPEATFCLSAPTYLIRAYCNVHGLWEKE
ncbi:MAG: desulfoferrodoxin [Patescibacteria group bacterium]